MELGVGRRYAALRVAHVAVGVGLCSLVGTPAFSARRRQRLPRARRGRWRLPGLVDLQREVIKTHDAVVSDRPLYVTANILSYGGGEHGWPRMGASAGEAFFLLLRPGVLLPAPQAFLANVLRLLQRRQISAALVCSSAFLYLLLGLLHFVPLPKQGSWSFPLPDSTSTAGSNRLLIWSCVFLFICFVLRGQVFSHKQFPSFSLPRSRLMQI